jgi:hypothetical protein
VDELRAKINEFSDQLALIKEALKDSPNNPEYLKLKGDLEEIIEIYVSVC